MQAYDVCGSIQHPSSPKLAKWSCISTTNSTVLILNFQKFFYRQARTPRTRNSPDGAVVTRDTSNVEISGSIPLLGNLFFFLRATKVGLILFFMLHSFLWWGLCGV